ncbi:MAG: TetR family transcriptional regulator C-terminal domain-containing protein [Azonexus sp.]
MSGKAAISPSTGANELARERILDAAFGEIRRQGFQAASVSAILAETGLTKGALYHYFPSKKELGLAVVDERVAAALRCSILDGLSVSEDDIAPLDKLFKLLDAVQAWTEDSIRLGCPLNNLMQEMSAVDEDFRRHLTAIVALWQERVAGLLRQAQKQGLVAAQVDCHAAALFIVAAWEGCISIAKNMQSMPVFVASIEQLKHYVRHLQPA